MSCDSSTANGEFFYIQFDLGTKKGSFRSPLV
ncbi:Hypothetical protein Bdt_3698 [Bdellovibrio bacteriovorus str. Tiberius]|uniref:Uncharacterized protein n=1 Tax=Bdellovibrio bacteriovorus str. Tiberius TaxID=1069642 RepID=K7YTY3_BDEBC|nr:Hypothetical protein Bdt_3698 [Bdellovibrio bacteriovorus str. Tiberius]